MHGDRRPRAAGADLMLCEASFADPADRPNPSSPPNPPGVHLTGRQAGQHAARAGVGELVLTHLVPWNDQAATAAEAAGAFSGPLSLASGGRILDLG